MTRRKRDVMIVDFNKCLRIPPEDAPLARSTKPYRCPNCATRGYNLTPQTLSGKLRFDGDAIPQCEDHDEPVDMVPV